MLGDYCSKRLSIRDVWLHAKVSLMAGGIGEEKGGGGPGTMLYTANTRLHGDL